MVTALSQAEKLHVIYRVEPGCLGPRGLDHIEDFCRHVAQDLQSLDAGYVIWEIIPRYDKKLPEMAYRVMNKNMSHQQAERYLGLFGKSLDEFEGHLVERIAELIGEFMPGRA